MKNTVRQIVRSIPVVGPLFRKIYRILINPQKPFSSSADYWVKRYNSGGTSGDGSYNDLAEFKAEVLNNFVEQENVQTVIEYGCGDGNQLRLAKYLSYVGFDVSPRAVEVCRNLFSGDSTKIFRLTEEYSTETAELTLSLDVIYHLVEDEVFESYLTRLFDSSEKHVIIYSSNINITEKSQDKAAHVRHRRFMDWVDETKTGEWKLVRYIPNRYPFRGDTRTGSFADFFIFARC